MNTLHTGPATLGQLLALLTFPDPPRRPDYSHSHTNCAACGAVIPPGRAARSGGPCRESAVA